MESKVKDPDRKVGFGKLVLWQSSSVSVALTALVMGFVTIYCTDTLHLDPLMVGTLFMVSRIVDAITDTVVGVIIDRTNTRWGKGRPYEIFMLFLWLATWLLFSTPTGFSDTAKYIWIFVMYVFMNAVCKTFLNGNNIVYLVRAFKTKEQQVKVTAYGSFFTMGGSMIFNIAFPMAMARIATSAAGWSRLMAMIAVPLTILGLLRMLTIKEQYNNENDTKSDAEKLKLQDVFDVIKTNRYLLSILFVGLIFSLVANMGAAVYYWTWIVGNVGLMGVTAVFSIVGLPLAFLMPMWQRKFGLGRMCMAGLAVAAVGYACVFFAGGNLIPLVICLLLTQLGNVPFNMMKNIFIVDLATYNEREGKQRMEGTMNALLGLMDKIGQAGGGFILGLLMSLSGYDGALTVQPDSALMMIRMSMSLVPAVALIICVVLLYGYKLDEILKKDQTAQLGEN